MAAEKEPAMFAFVAFLKVPVSILINNCGAGMMSGSTSLHPPPTVIFFPHVVLCNILKSIAIMHGCFDILSYLQHLDQKVFYTASVVLTNVDAMDR